jgi:hypothetical protein
MEEYWIVIDNKTGRNICQCADINDVMMMVNFDPHHRSYICKKFILDQVIDVTSTTDKQLPGQLGLSDGNVNILESHKIRLPEGQQKPIEV